MFRGLTNDRSDITGAYIPEPASPPPQSVPLKSPYNSDQEFTAIETRITSATSVLYSQFFDWNNFYITKFPSTFSALPAMATRDDKVLINMDAANTTFNLNKRNFTISEPNDLAATLLYGIHLRMLRKLTDDNALTMMYTPIVNFIYSLIVRIYGRDMDTTTLSNDNIACLYYCIARLVLSNYFLLIGSNANSLAMRITHNFFTQDFKNRVTYNPGKLPFDQNLESYETIFMYLDRNNIIPSAELNDFRHKVIQSFSLSALLCLTNGTTLASMMLSCRIPSNVFNDRVIKIQPRAVRDISAAIARYITKANLNAKANKDAQSIRNARPNSDWQWDY